MKRIAVLGSTGSIGVNILKVVKDNLENFKIVGLTANYNVNLLSEQIKTFKPEVAAVANAAKARELRDMIGPGRKIKIETGEEGLCRTAAWPEADLVVMATVGSSGLMPTLRAIEAGKDIAIANKEPLIMAGRIIVEKAHKRSVQILPLDSEHCAIFQCLDGRDKLNVRRIILTGSGGPFKNTPVGNMHRIKPEQALKHPRWKMGKKVSIDSATMMNKGLEVIEANALFDIEIEKIQILIHPEAIIHSMVEFIDGSIIAQLGPTDMRLPIQYALSYPRRIASEIPPLDFARIGKLSFEKPDLKKFPTIELCFYAGRTGGTMPAVLNAANEEAVEFFLSGKIKFTDIVRLVEEVMKRHSLVKDPALEDILEADEWAREQLKVLVNK